MKLFSFFAFLAAVAAAHKTAVLQRIQKHDHGNEETSEEPRESSSNGPKEVANEVKELEKDAVAVRTELDEAPEPTADDKLAAVSNAVEQIDNEADHLESKVEKKTAPAAEVAADAKETLAEAETAKVTKEVAEEKKEE